jgi:hypothetical protein
MAMALVQNLHTEFCLALCRQAMHRPLLAQSKYTARENDAAKEKSLTGQKSLNKLSYDDDKVL